MKVLVATDKPFAKVAVDGIRKEIEAAVTNSCCWRNNGEKSQAAGGCERCKTLSLSAVTSLMLKC